MSGEEEALAEVRAVAWGVVLADVGSIDVHDSREDAEEWASFYPPSYVVRIITEPASDLRYAAHIAPGDVRDYRRGYSEQVDRAEAAEAEVERLTDLLAKVEIREAVFAFVQHVASSGAYNGADDPGQRFYDWCLNSWLYDQASNWLRDREEAGE